MGKRGRAAECARKYGIKVLTQEVSSVRGGYTYKEVLGYFNFGEKYTSKTIQEDYLAVENQLDQEVVLSRKEILALILKKEHLEILNRLEDAIYEFGVDADAERDAFFGKYSDISQREIIEGVRRLIDPSNVLARYHPHTKPENPELEFDIDDSVSSLEWILKCRRIVLFSRGSFIKEYGRIYNSDKNVELHVVWLFCTMGFNV